MDKTVKERIPMQKMLAFEKDIPNCQQCVTRYIGGIYNRLGEYDEDIAAKLRPCGRCQGVLYCSVSHQLRDWEHHRSECMRLVGPKQEQPDWLNNVSPDWYPDAYVRRHWEEFERHARCKATLDAMLAVSAQPLLYFRLCSIDGAIAMIRHNEIVCFVRAEREGLFRVGPVTDNVHFRSKGRFTNLTSAVKDQLRAEGKCLSDYEILHL